MSQHINQDAITALIMRFRDSRTPFDMEAAQRCARLIVKEIEGSAALAQHTNSGKVAALEKIARGETHVFDDDLGENVIVSMDGEEMQEVARSALAPASQSNCTCPSGDGSLRHPCPEHPPERAEVPVLDEEAEFRRAFPPISLELSAPIYDEREKERGLKYIGWMKRAALAAPAADSAATEQAAASEWRTDLREATEDLLSAINGTATDEWLRGFIIGYPWTQPAERDERIKNALTQASSATFPETETRYIIDDTALADAFLCTADGAKPLRMISGSSMQPAERAAEPVETADDIPGLVTLMAQWKDAHGEAAGEIYGKIIQLIDRHRVAPATQSAAEPVDSVALNLEAQLRAVIVQRDSLLAAAPASADVGELLRAMCESFQWRTDGDVAKLVDRIAHHIRDLKAGTKARDTLLKAATAEMEAMERERDEARAALPASSAVPAKVQTWEDRVAAAWPSDPPSDVAHTEEGIAAMQAEIAEYRARAALSASAEKGKAS